MDEAGLCRIYDPRVKILIVHEVSYLSKIIYEFQILPEILSMMGHDITVVDYDDSWHTDKTTARLDFQPRIHRNVHRAYAGAAVTVRRPGLIRLPILSRISGAITETVEVVRAI